MEEKNTYTNDLIHSNNPYLLQHAHNPVNWVEWSQEAFDRAEAEGKLVLISVGYSSCHWCHVMERECFADEEVADMMNEVFVSIKVDREDRPDIDQHYMHAVQLMTQQGGWPLNCIAMPDGRAIFGGTYFPKDKWMAVMGQIWRLYQSNREKVVEYAEQLEEGMTLTSIIQVKESPEEFDKKAFSKLIQSWKLNFDFDEGGMNRAPKFPMPNNFEFLLSCGDIYKDETLLKQVDLTLEKMALGGIFDHLGGGFARYSVDAEWKVPHFEKMLYDNAQLLSLYAKANQRENNDLYKEVVDKNIAWLQTEMRDESGGYYSAIDADSEGVEGKFYTWTKAELEELLGDDFDWFADYYNVNDIGYWEADRYILLRKELDEDWCGKKGWKVSELKSRLDKTFSILIKHRNQRVRPITDDKQLTSWNAMLIKGYVDSGLAFQNQNYINEAINIANWIVEYQLDKTTNQLQRSRRLGKSSTNGFLKDYAHTIDAFVALYEATFNRKWLDYAKQLSDYTIAHFYDEQSKMFFFTEDESTILSRKIEIYDNVIPSPNSVMAISLFKLGKILNLKDYESIAKQMLSNIYSDMLKHEASFFNWSALTLMFLNPFREVMITGEDAQEVRMKMGVYFIPNAVFMGGNKADLSMLEHKSYEKESTIYVCQNYTCSSPVKTIEEAIKKLSRPDIMIQDL